MLGRAFRSNRLLTCAAFQTIFNPASGRSPKALTAFRKNLEDTFARALNHGDKSKKSRIQLDDNIVECFSTLSSKSKDQEFEDLVYFILDLHQFNGVGVALAEIDIEQVRRFGQEPRARC
jgi:separase